jgi:glycosyltransferase involved in cell wall biosynthesis
MRIAILSWESLYSIAVGGVAAHVTQLAVALHQRGHKVHVFTRRGPGQPFYSQIDGVHYYRCSYLPHADFVEEVNNMCRSFVDHAFEVEDRFGPFDVVHAHDWLTANAMIWIKQGRARRGIITLHSTEFGRCGNQFYNGQCERIRMQELAGICWADRVITVSGALGRQIQWLYAAPEGKMTVIANGVETRRFDVAAKADVEDRSRPVVFFCGRLTLQKGPDLLINAIPMVLNVHPGASFVFAGDGDMRASLEDRVRGLGVSDSISFLGYRNGDGLVHLFQRADVVCVPSRNEPFGIVVLEAWCARKPVVVTDTGGPGEYVRHEINGLKIYPTSDSVAWGVQAVLDHPERGRWMGENGRKLVEAEFGWDEIAGRTETVYDYDGAGRYFVEDDKCPTDAMAEDDCHAQFARPRSSLTDRVSGLQSCILRTSSNTNGTTNGHREPIGTSREKCTVA